MIPRKQQRKIFLIEQSADRKYCLCENENNRGCHALDVMEIIRCLEPSDWLKSLIFGHEVHGHFVLSNQNKDESACEPTCAVRVPHGLRKSI